MQKRGKTKHLYQRGEFWLDWDRKRDGSLRSPYLSVFWYDGARGRVRSASTGTDDLQAAKTALDARYLQHSEGEAICPTCGQRRQGAGDVLVLRAITDYLTSNADLASIGSVRPRLNHVVRYIATLSSFDIPCSKVDEKWVQRFREWCAKQPVVSTAGTDRTEQRAASTIENSVLQLAAAIKAAHKRGDAARPPMFKPIATKELNRTPQRRLSVDDLASAFSYATDPRFPVKRLGLHRFLMISVGTAARPDAAHDFSTVSERRQWNPERRVIALNPANRRQTRKRRAVVIAPVQLVGCIDAVTGPFVPAVSIRSAWDSMCDQLRWPHDGSSGMKLIRRSIAQLLRDAGTPRAWSDEWKAPERRVPVEQIELQLGHRKIDSVTDLYAAFDPEYLSLATAAIEGIIEAITVLCPGAFPSETATTDGD